MGVGVDVGVDAGVGGWRFRRKSAGAGTGADLCVGVGIFINVHVSLYAWYLPPIARKARTVPSALFCMPVSMDTVLRTLCVCMRACG